MKKKITRGVVIALLIISIIFGIGTLFFSPYFVWPAIFSAWFSERFFKEY